MGMIEGIRFDDLLQSVRILLEIYSRLEFCDNFILWLKPINTWTWCHFLPFTDLA